MNVILTAIYLDGTTETFVMKRGFHYNLVQKLRNAGATVIGDLD